MALKNIYILMLKKKQYLAMEPFKKLMRTKRKQSNIQMDKKYNLIIIFNE